MLFTDLFIIKENGICFFSWNETHPGRGDYYTDLVSPFFMAINAFANENYKEKIRCIELVDGICIYFKHVNLAGDVKVTVAGVFPDHVNGSRGSIDKKIMALKWELDKHIPAIRSSAVLPPETREKIRNKILVEFEERPGNGRAAITIH
jgi:hypothetical protein